MTTAAAPSEAAAQDIQAAALGKGTPMPENTTEIPDPVPDRFAAIAKSSDGPTCPVPWLCPIQSDSKRRGILQMTAAEYFDLVDKSGRMTRSNKRGAVVANLAPILMGVHASADRLFGRHSDHRTRVATSSRPFLFPDLDVVRSTTALFGPRPHSREWCTTWRESCGPPFAY
jgi:hypothetical protein